jgi:hypothetical protein
MSEINKKKGLMDKLTIRVVFKRQFLIKYNRLFMNLLQMSFCRHILKNNE